VKQRKKDGFSFVGLVLAVFGALLVAGLGFC